MSTDKFIGCFGEKEIANLRTCVKVVDLLEGLCVPETDAAVCSSTTGCKEIVLMWGPCKSFYCCEMLMESMQTILLFKRPNNQLIIIPTWSKKSLIKWPLQPTNLLFMSNIFYLLRFLASNITQKNIPISRSRSNEFIVPCKWPNSGDMSIECSDNLFLHGVIDFYFAHGVSNCYLVHSGGPAYRGDLVVIGNFT